MKVKELRDYLAGYADDTPVILAKDAEGNGFSPLEGLSAEYYVENTAYSGELDFYEDAGVPCVVLWPVN